MSFRCAEAAGIPVDNSLLSELPVDFHKNMARTLHHATAISPLVLLLPLMASRPHGSLLDLVKVRYFLSWDSHS
jgi:hypothetical protein